MFRRRESLIAIACALAGTLGCEAPSTAPSDLTQAPLARGVEPEFLPGLEALQAAVREGENEVAERILARLMARRPHGRTLEMVQGFANILEGRALLGQLDLTLATRPDDSDPKALHLFLRASSSHPRELELAPGPATLEVVRLAVDPLGREQRSRETRAVEGLERIRLAPEGSIEVDLASVGLSVPRGSLACRLRWRLELRGGSLLREGESYPAQSWTVEPFETTRLASFLPTQSVPPEELARFVREEELSMPRLMERAVRILPAQRSQALELLSPAVARMSPGQIRSLVPVLRWLSGEDAPGGDPMAWKVWLERRRTALDPDRPALELPSERSVRSSLSAGAPGG